MKKTLKLTAALIGIAALSSCEEEYKPQDFTEPKENAVTFSVTAKQGDEPVIWTEQSRIGIFCDVLEQINTPVTISASSSGTEEGLFIAPFEWGGNSEHTFSIYSPYSETSGSKISGTLPSSWSQSGQSQEHLASESVLYGKTSSLPLEKGQSLPVALSPIFRTFRISINTTEYLSYNLDKVVISSTTGKPLSGTYTFDILTEEIEITSQEQAPLSLSISGCTLGDGTVSVYFLMKDGFTDECTVEITVSDKEDNITVLTGKTRITAETSLDIDEFESSAAVDESIDLSDPDGDGIKETANCYVAGIAGQTYRFPATVMGNGYTTPADNSYELSDGVTGSSPGITPQPLNPASAQILWQTEKALITDVDMRKGYIYFTVNGQTGGALTPGNAVIAAYSEAGGKGHIIWSWHIWVTDADLSSRLQTWTVHKDFASCSEYQNPQLMDRNLGALSDNDFGESGKNWSKGLNYQWGRKDPFVGPDNTEYTSRVAVSTYDHTGQQFGPMTKAETFSTESAWTHVDKKIPSSEISRYPMAFVSGQSNYFWLEEVAHDLWGCPGYSDDSNNLGHKTIYDPCPPGYRVMSAYAMTGITATPEGGKLAGTEHKVINNGTYRDNKADLQVSRNGNEIAKLPASGIVYFEKDEKFFPFDRTGTYGYIWSAKMTPTSSNKAFRMSFDWNNFRPKEPAYCSYGHNVRCEKIK